MDHENSNSRPLLQQSSSEEDEEFMSAPNSTGTIKNSMSDSSTISSSGVTTALPGSRQKSLDGSSGSNIVTSRRLNGNGDKSTEDDKKYDNEDQDVDDYADDDDDDDCNSVSVDMTKELIRSANDDIPQDRYNFNYIIFYLLGMTTLLPWNFFITAEDYWMYKFRDISNNSTTPPGSLTPTQAGFTSDLSVCSAIPNTIFLIVNAFIGHRIPLGFRMVGSLIVVLIFFIVTTALVEVDTDSWQHLFLQFTLSTVVLMNIASAILSGGLFGISGQFPSEYITAVVSGQALGGIFAAIAEIISLTFGASPKTSGFVYFMIGNFVLFCSLILYLIMANTKFFKFYTIDKMVKKYRQIPSESSTSTTLSDEPTTSALTTSYNTNSTINSSSLDSIVTTTAVAAPPITTMSSSSLSSVAIIDEPNFYTVFHKIWIYGLTEWLVFVVTLCVYPSITVLVSSQNHGNGHPWNDIYFVPVVNYLIFNSGDYLGRIVAGMLEWPTNRPKTVALASVLRFLFVPALIFCNTNPRRFLPTLIHSDIIFVILMGLFSVSNGYLANLALILAPKNVQAHEKEMASSMMAAFLGIGLAFGSSISLILVNLI